MADEPPLRFTGQLADPKLEATFLEERAPELRRYLTLSLGVASAVFLAYGLHDAWVVPELGTRAWAVRYAVFPPVALAVFLALRSPHFLRLSQALALTYGLTASFVVLYIGARAEPPGFFIYTSYSVLFVTLGPFVARMSVRTQLLYTVASVLLYVALDATYVHSAAAIRASIVTTLMSLGALGAFLAYQLERRDRLAFLQRKLIERQVAELDAERQRSEELLLNVLPPSIAERLKGEKRAIADGFERVSVLFADIVGFTRMTERLPPEVLVERLNTVFSLFDDLVDTLKLEKIKTIGDAYMVAGGLHSLEYDHAQAVAEMALAMKRRLQDYRAQIGEPLDIRIGIHTGPVVAGVIGKKKFIYDVWGDTVNTASRMESHAESGKIQVSETTAALLKDSYELMDRGEIEVKGKGRMRTFYLEGRLPDSSGKRAAKTVQPRLL
ncbi:MAG: hypothetical protein KF718_12650 [Polyangiaceae bacterium]|nr:hypothetical protein [Polyangiaceae bacterium]